MTHTDIDNRDHSNAIALLIDGFTRVDEQIPDVTSDLSPQDLMWRPDPDANSIGWLAWHLTRVADDHIAGITDSPQAWVEEGWVNRFGLPYAEESIGYGQTSAEVGDFTVKNAGLLVDYWRATFARITQALSELQDDDLERILDNSYDPPVTVSIRLMSVVNDLTQHVGQAAYVRGLLERRRG
ncbi:MAG: DinB family protein [Propionibacteriaceae bacterium]|nr:DinB family protein [Propionibacteriaceae bacterium]